MLPIPIAAVRHRHVEWPSRHAPRAVPGPSVKPRIPFSLAAASSACFVAGRKKCRPASSLARGSMAGHHDAKAKLRILLIIHGYPPLYNAGSEVYTQTLARSLADNGHDVLVFCREEDTIAPYFRMRDDFDGKVPLKIINLPNFRDRYRVVEVDEAVKAIVEDFSPDVVHCGHLNHLSMSLVDVVTKKNIPFLYTLHDFWLNCPRGQFIQFTGENESDLWPVCDGQEDTKCAQRCYVPRIGSGDPSSSEDEKYWTSWIAKRMAFTRATCDKIDLFIAPAQHLKNRFIQEGFAPQSKVVYCDYGFDLERLTGRMRKADEPFTFAYIGTHKESKGVQHLIEAFAELMQDESLPATRLKIYGRTLGQSTAALRRLAESLLPPSSPASANLDWCGEYCNERIVEDVFNKVDAIVVPSIWLENSPLVIHEALQAGVLVITAAVGGMAEYVHHEVNGLLFKHRSPKALEEQMRRCLLDPAWAKSLANRGYLLSKDGEIPPIADHVDQMVELYRKAIEHRRSSNVGQGKLLPWRITFDTNPDDCNLHCDMCEGFSQYSTVKAERKGLDPRRMPFELVEKVLTEFVDLHLKSSGDSTALEVIPSTMGEPLLYEHFEQMLSLIQQEDKRLKDQGLPGLRLNLTTNGTFPKLGAERWAPKVLPITSDIKISWNGATKGTQESIMRGQKFEDVLENVKVLVSERDALAKAGGNFCRLTFQLTFLEENYREIPDIIRLAAELGVNRVKGHHLWSHWKEMDGRSMKRDADAASRWNKMVPLAEEIADANGVLLEGIHVIPETAAEDLAPGAPCPFLAKEVSVAADGRFNVCCAPNDQRLQLGYFGNLGENSLEEILSGEPYQSLLSTYSTCALCQGCNMRRWPQLPKP
eukprot:s8_g9.t1